MSEIIPTAETPELAECRELVQRLRVAQTNAGIKDNAFVSRFRNEKNALLFGSVRTWERIQEGNWTCNDPVKLLPRLRLCVSQLDGGSLRAEVFTDLPFYAIAASQLVKLEGQTNDRRCLLILAPTGVGKTSFLRTAAAKPGKARFYLRCSPPLRDRGSAIVAAIYRAVTGEQLIAPSYDTALQRLTSRLSATPCTVFIDEAHDGGVALMKIIRYLIDETPSRFVLAAYPTDYHRVISASSGSLSEARQFIGRCLKPVLDDYRDGTKPSDVARMLAGAGFPGDAEFATLIHSHIAQREGLRTLADAIEAAQTQAMARDLAPTREHLTAALDIITGQRNAVVKEVAK